MDGIKSLNNDVADDAKARFDADFVLMAETFSDFISALLGIFASKIDIKQAA